MNSPSVKDHVEVIPQQKPSKEVIDQHLEDARVLTIVKSRTIAGIVC